MYSDPQGNAPKAWQIVLGIIGAALVATAAVTAIIGTGGVGAFGLGALIGSISLGAVGAAVGGVIGYATGGTEGILGGVLAGFGIGSIVGFVVGGIININAYNSSLGTDFGKMGTVVKHPKLKVDWSKQMIHGPERMLKRGMNKKLVNSTVRKGIALQQSGGQYAFVTKKAVSVVSKTGVLITTYSEAFFDAGMLEILNILFG